MVGSLGILGASPLNGRERLRLLQGGGEISVLASDHFAYLAASQGVVTGITPSGGDDYAALAATMAANSVVGLIPGATYLISQPLAMRSNKRLFLNGATLKAHPSFPVGQPLTKVYDTVNTYAFNVNISDGILDGSFLAGYAQENVNGRFTFSRNLKTTQALLGGATIGTTGLQLSDNYLENVVSWFHESGNPIPGYEVNDPAGIGIYFGNTTDSGAKDCKSIGYRKGFRASNGSVHLHTVHSWGRKAHGPLISCFEQGTAGGGLTLDDAYADTPHNWKWDTGTSAYVQDTSITSVFGFDFEGFDVDGTNLRVFNNPSTAPSIGLIVPIKIGQAGGGYHSLKGLHFNGTSTYTFATCIQGNAANSEILSISDNGAATYVDISNRRLRIGNSETQFDKYSKFADILECAGTWQLPFKMGFYRLWVNATSGKLYIKNAAPTSDTDGTVVGAQT